MIIRQTTHASCILATLAVLAGCAGQTPQLLPATAQSRAPDQLERCRSIRDVIKHRISRAGVTDAQSRSVAGYPYLRINRFLAHLGRQLIATQRNNAFTEWLARLRRLDEQAVRIELGNLPRLERMHLSTEILGRRASIEKVESAYRTCADTFLERLTKSHTQRQQLLRAAEVADDYSDLAQLVGVFPLTSIPVSLGWENWKRKHLPTFQKPIDQLPVQGKLVEWVPLPEARSLKHHQVRAIIEHSRDTAFGIPEPRGRNLNRLFETFAPVWQVDVAGDHDYAGHPEWVADGSSVRINPSRPSVFKQVSHIIHDGQILLQLNYAIWFQARPRKGPLDLLGGHLDGVIWRVTLGRDGRPLVYDTIHACGCYHLLFPSRNSALAKSRNVGRGLKERPAVLRGPEVQRAGQRMVLRLASGSHYLLGISIARSHQGEFERRPYRLVDADALRSLQLTRSRKRSLFGPDGLIVGTERLERFLLWPTGVRSPGALRQWGRHAIAFAERRHFDDPFLFQKIFN